MVSLNFAEVQDRSQEVEGLNPEGLAQVLLLLVNSVVNDDDVFGFYQNRIQKLPDELLSNESLQYERECSRNRVEGFDGSIAHIEGSIAGQTHDALNVEFSLLGDHFPVYCLALQRKSERTSYNELAGLIHVID